MKILLLDSGRRAGPEGIAMWSQRLGLQPGDEVSLLAWNPPREPLPLAHHLVFGPQLRPYPGRGRRMETASAAPPEPTPAPTPKLPAEAPNVATAPAAEVSATPATTATPATPATAGTARPAALPVYHPSRVRQGLRRRARRDELLGRRAAARAKSEVTSRVVTPERRRDLANRAVSARFMASVAASAEARALFAAADVVVPMDTRSQPAAWLLAQRIEGPDVVVGFPAAQRVIEGRRGA